MKVALYARVSTMRQAQAQTTQQQLTRLQTYLQQQGWSLDQAVVFRDDGYSGAKLSRPGLDDLRDRVALGEFERILITDPDRLARKYIHQVLLIEEFQQRGCRVEFIDRPMSSDPNDQLLLQIRGAVAEYERSLITERMRRGKLAKLRGGQLLPWTRRPFGYQLDAEHPRDPAGVKIDEYEAAIIRQIFAWYLQPGATLHSIAKKLREAAIASPRGRACWTTGSIRGVLTNLAYTGTAYANRYRSVPARGRRSPLLAMGPGQSHELKPKAEWIAIMVPAIVSHEEMELVQEKLSHNQQTAPRNNKKHEYLLRGRVSCGCCLRTAPARTTMCGYGYYTCLGRTDKQRRAEGKVCAARMIPSNQLDQVVWADLCAVLTDREQVMAALQRVKEGQWLPQELQSRQKTLKQAIAAITRQQERLLEAYLNEVVGLQEFERKREELSKRQEGLRKQLREIDSMAEQEIELGAIAESIERFCEQVRKGLEESSFAQKRMLVELLIDRVVVKDGDVEIRYVVPTSPAGVSQDFCHLRIDYRRSLSLRV
jgi:site-specific DNA recombinase